MVIRQTTLSRLKSVNNVRCTLKESLTRQYQNLCQNQLTLYRLTCQAQLSESAMLVSNSSSGFRKVSIKSATSFLAWSKSMPAVCDACEWRIGWLYCSMKYENCASLRSAFSFKYNAEARSLHICYSYGPIPLLR